MAAQRGKKIKPDQVVITHIRRAGSGVIAMSRSGGAEVQLKTNANLSRDRLTIADVKGKLELVTSTETEFVSVPRGRSGTTLYRMLHFDDPGFWDRIFRRREPTVRLKAIRMFEDVGHVSVGGGSQGARDERAVIDAT